MHKSLRLTTLLLLVTANPVFAQEEGQGGLLAIDTGLMVWTVLVFLIVLGLLYRFAYPHILGAVEAREARIRDLLAQAETDREAARVAVEGQQKQLDETRTRILEMVAEGRLTGERTRDELIAEGRRNAEELLHRARRDVRQELDSALEELRVEAVEIALAAASKLVDRNLDEVDNRRLVREYLAEIEASGTAGARG
jgi:F-type H+-transporting ATPase subunit b